MHQCLAEVASRREPGAIHDLLHLAAQQRHLGHAGAVRGRREQSDETMLADNLPVRTVTLDTDVVDVAGAVHGRARIRLGRHQHRRRCPRQRARLGRQHRETARHRGTALRLAQDAEPAAGNQPQHDVVLRAGKIVLAIAEQQKVVFRQPLQEVAVFGDLLARQRRRLAVDLLDHRAQLRNHRLPVGDDGAHVAEHTLDAFGKASPRRRIGQSIDFEMHV